MTLEVGRITKAHGLKGQLIVNLTTDRTGERTAPGALLFAGDDGRVLEVVKAAPHKNNWLVSFVGVTTREQAEALQGMQLTAEHLDAAELDDPDAVFAHELIGRRLVDQHGTDHGEILSLIDNPASDLLELSGDRLVPLVFYVEHDDETVRVDIPAGLLDPDEQV